jgi:glycosyltransferase involved in cell wall biosynthesis
MIRILLIGPLPPPMGGDTRHFKTLLTDLREHPEFQVTVIDTSRGVQHSNPLRNLFVTLRTLLRLAWRLPATDVVSYQASDRGMLLFGPVVVMLCRVARRPCILRVFGGSFGDSLRTLNGWRRRLLERTVLSAEVLLLQTRRAVRELQPQARARVQWFSTYVEAPGADPRTGADAARCTRFVFLGHLWRTKGVETLLAAAPSLPPDCSIDLYGTPDEYSAEDIERRGGGRVRYRGFLTHAEVNRVLWDYHCLVLPTFHPGEGYPGVIAEAFAHGLPVICTRWLAIPEMADDTCALLIEPNDTAGFLAAVTTLHDDPLLWKRLQQGARARAASFDHATWAKEFESLCRQLVKR